MPQKHRPTILFHAPALYALLPVAVAYTKAHAEIGENEVCELQWNHARPPLCDSDMLFVIFPDEAGGDEYTIVECDDGRFWFTTNHNDPDGAPQTFAEHAEDITARTFFKDGVLEIDSVPPSNFYGGYAATIELALDGVIKMHKNDIADWPKDYTKPKPAVALA